MHLELNDWWGGYAGPSGRPRWKEQAPVKLNHNGLTTVKQCPVALGRAATYEALHRLGTDAGHDLEESSYSESLYER